MKIGIIGSGLIVNQALSSMQKQNIEVTALWCRDEAKGTALIEQYGIKSLYVDYKGFLKDDSYDTVYCGLINNLHYIYCLKALEAGKNVICEKPFTVSYDNAVALVRLANEKNLLIFEAILSRYSHNLAALKKELEGIGEIKMVNAVYGQYSRRYDLYKQGTVLPAFDPALAGGALYDINVYNLHMMAELFGMPKGLDYRAEKGFNGVDLSGTIELDYGSFKALLFGAKNCVGLNGTSIFGTDGYVTVANRPGFVRDILTYHRADGKEVQVATVAEEDPMAVEFARIGEIVDQKDFATANRWMDTSLITSYLVQQAARSAQIPYGSDKKEI